MFQCWSFNLILVFELFLGQLRLSSTQLGLWNCHAWLISSKIEKDETWNEGIEGIIGFYDSVCTFCLFDSCVHWCSTPLELAPGRCCPQRVWTCWEWLALPLAFTADFSGRHDLIKTLNFQRARNTIIPSIQNNTTWHSRTKNKKDHTWTGMNCVPPKDQFYLSGDDCKLKLYCVVLCELKPFATRSSRDMMGRVRCVERECMNCAAVMWWNPTWWGWSCRPLQRMGLGVVEQLKVRNCSVILSCASSQQLFDSFWSFRFQLQRSLVV